MSDFKDDFKIHQDALASEENFQPVFHSTAFFPSYNRDNGNIRVPMTRKRYEHYRPGETIPEGNTQTELRQIMRDCEAVYDRCGVVRSVIDMMSEFGAEGIEIIHPDEEPNNFYKSWMKKVNLEERTERFLNWLYKSGNVVVRRRNSQINNSAIRKMKRGSEAKANINYGLVPTSYVFYNPAQIEVVGDYLGTVSNNKIYALRLPSQGFNSLNKPKNDLEEKVYDGLPKEVKDLSNGKNIQGNYYVALPSDKIFVGHYKKDDTAIWAKSFIYSILPYVYYNDKLQLARITTLDNMISSIRLWKLGDHKAELLPSPGSGQKLANILSNNGGGGPVDIIWDSAIELQDFYPPIEKLSQFQEEYHPILLGLGVPESLVGGSQNGSNFGGASIGLKNLIKRLEAGRRVVKEWLTEEIRIINKNMGFRKMPEIRFSNADLHDERTYFQLLLQLVDRNILPDDRILEIINEFPEFENRRIQKQQSDRENGKRPKKASPYHNPQLDQVQEHDMQKINVTNESRKGEPTRERPGRPDNSQDQVTRQRSPNTTPSFSTIFLKASELYDQVESFVQKLMMQYYNVSSARKLTSEQKNNIEEAIDQIYSGINPNENYSESTIVEAYNNIHNNVHYRTYMQNYSNLVSSDKITIAKKRDLKILAYTNTWCINCYENI